MAGKKLTAAKRRKLREQRKINKFQRVLLRFKKLKAKQRRQVIEAANAKFIRDIIAEVKKLRRSTNIRPILRRKLKQHAKVLRKLTNKNTSLKVQRDVLSQRGGFLPLLLAALPAIGSIAGGILSRT